MEKEWLDDTRFQPIITDMRRTVQPVVRYKMNDILHLTTCTCGSKMVAVSQIEGRTDDVLRFPGNISLFPDFIRRAIIGAHKDITNYQIIQDNPESLSLYVSPQHHWDDAAQALMQLLEQQHILGVTVLKAATKTHVQGTKFRRIHAQRH